MKLGHAQFECLNCSLSPNTKVLLTDLIRYRSMNHAIYYRPVTFSLSLAPFFLFHDSHLYT